MTSYEFLTNIFNDYSQRGYLQSEIAQKYNVNKCTISFLLNRLGYVYGKRIKDISITDALKDSDVRNTVEKIVCNM